MDWESEEINEVKETKDTSKRIWYVIIIGILVMIGVLFLQEGKKGETRTIGAHVKHILVKVEAGDTKGRDVALEKIKDIKRQLDEGANFSALAAKYSDDPDTKTKGGELGWLSKGTMSKGFEEYVWSGPIGEYSNPVETTFGFHIIYIVERNLSSAEEYQLDVNRRLNETQ